MIVIGAVLGMAAVAIRYTIWKGIRDAQTKEGAPRCAPLASRETERHRIGGCTTNSRLVC